MRFPILAFVLFPLAVSAQTPPVPPAPPSPPDPAAMQARNAAQAKARAYQEQGFISAVTDAFKREAALRAQVLQLQDELTAAKAVKPPAN
jgi:hypothetical protein